MEDITKWNNQCETYVLFDILGKKWTIFIIFLIQKEYHSFNAMLKVLTKLNSKVLAERLKQLEEINLIEIKKDEKNGRSTYFLTPKWESVAKHIAELSSEHANSVVEEMKKTLS